jgi:hypothetical protein
VAYKRAQVTVRYRPQSERLMDQVRGVLRYYHYAIRIEQAYVSWILQIATAPPVASAASLKRSKNRPQSFFPSLGSPKLYRLLDLTSALRVSRRALATTNKELRDMPMAAIQGAT